MSDSVPEGFIEWYEARQKQIDEYHAHQNMHREAISHDVFEWMETLSKDGIGMLGLLVKASIDNPEYGYQLLGMLQMHQKYKFNVCPVCDKDHDKMYEDLAGEGEPGPEPKTGDKIPDSPFSVGDAEAFDAGALNIPARPFKETQSLCAEYGVTVPIVGTQVFCLKCNQPYVSLEDRMIKPPGDCDGCYQYEKTGQRFADPFK